MTTQLFAPSASHNFTYSFGNNSLTISGYSRTHEEYTLGHGAPIVPPVRIIINNTSVTLKIKVPSKVDIILFPGESYDYSAYIGTGTLLTIWPCVLMNLSTT